MPKERNAQSGIGQYISVFTHTKMQYNKQERINASESIEGMYNCLKIDKGSLKVCHWLYTGWEWVQRK